MVGRDIEPARRREGNQASNVVLETKKLSLEWPGHPRGWRLKDIHFKLNRGEILGFAGLMGAGRTELLECLFGASSVQSADCLGISRTTADRHWAYAKAALFCALTDRT